MRVITRSVEETENAGVRLGSFLKRHALRTVLIYGDLGAGKTSFIKGVASAFGIPAREIGSASFVIAAEYDTSPPFRHIDLYRLDGKSDLEELGIWEYIESDGIAVVEWAERLSECPENAVRVSINYIDENSREIIFEGIPENSIENE